MKGEFLPGDMVITPLGRVGTVLREAYDGRLEVEYVGNKPLHPDGLVILSPDLLRPYER